MDNKKMEQLNNAIRDLLNEYDHENTVYGVNEILSVWDGNKADLIATLSKHPNWDAENFRIVFSEDYTRDFDNSAIYDFNAWVRKAYDKKVMDSYVAPQIEGKSYEEYYEAHEEKSGLISTIRRLKSRLDSDGSDIIIRGVSAKEMSDEYNSEQLKLEAFNQEFKSVTLYGGCNTYYLPKETYINRKLLIDFSCLMESDKVNGNTVTQEFANRFSELFPNIQCAVGTRIVKIVRKVCMEFKLDQIKEMVNSTWTDQNGVEHSREKDMGYNFQIAKLGDGINPLKIKRHTIISVNPLDFFTMSFGNGWASCHTIDKENRRNCRGSYEGQYCSGTLSYMLDGATVLFYTVDAEYNGNDFENESKVNRCTFHFNKDFNVMVQGRVYPDGRDGGDRGLAAQFRAVMQKVISDCTGNTNLWTVKKGTCNCGSYTRSYGTHYRDYTHYEDCTVSLLKGVEEYDRVEIGHYPICPNCGNEHRREEYLCCDECQSGYDYHCERCGEGITDENLSWGDAIYCSDNDCYYCCSECANRDGVYFCEDDERYHTEDECWYSDQHDCYYHRYEIVTEDGTYFRNEEDAREAGYCMTDDEEWYPEDEVAYDENKEIWFRFFGDDNAVNVNGQWFVNRESAHEAGFIMYDGTWYSSEDINEDAYTGELFPNDLVGMVTVEKEDGNELYYRCRANAEADGYTEVDGVWVKAESEVA